MKPIDFLPDVYRQRAALRRARLWWGLVMLLFGTAIGASIATQSWLRAGLRAELEALEPQFRQTQAQVDDLAQLQTKFARLSVEAGIYTLLENPWPRTQILAELIRPLPETIRLLRLQITEDEQAAAALGGQRPGSSDEDLAKLPPAEQDLARMLREVRRRRTAVELEGQASDVKPIHAYLAALSASPLVAQAQIKSLEASSGGDGRTRFTLRVKIVPGLCETIEDKQGERTAGPSRPVGREGGSG
jgi:Tfp pilus assembly protein PilN